MAFRRGDNHMLSFSENRLALSISYSSSYEKREERRFWVRVKSETLVDLRLSKM